MRATWRLLVAGVIGFAPLAAAQSLPLRPEAANPPSTSLIRDIDGERSDVRFELRILLRHLEGRFLSLHGNLRIDETVQRADIAVSIDSNSVWMAKESNAEYARSGEFFDAAHHPQIRFQATAVPLSLFREGGEMPGRVTLRGVTRPLTLSVDPASCERPGDDCDVIARGTVDRSDFGMTSKTLFVGKRVELSFRIRLRETPAPETPATVSPTPGREHRP
ncbi:MAG: YceI family protein [Xanthomonadales bacterium]|nr:YceI family protein [Xanthomonadales bacterium]